MAFRKDNEDTIKKQSEGSNEISYFQLSCQPDTIEFDHPSNLILREESELTSTNHVQESGNLHNTESTAKGFDNPDLLSRSMFDCLKYLNEEKEDDMSPNCEGVFQCLKTDCKYIDDLNEKNSCSFICEHNQHIHKFIVHENILTDKVDQSIFALHNENPQMEAGNYLVFSTSLSKFANKPAIWGKSLHHNISSLQEEEDLDCDVSCIANQHSHDITWCSLPELNHSKPIKHKCLLPDIEQFLPFQIESDEDEDIEENYLDTMWTSCRTPNLPSCCMIVKSVKNFYDNPMTHSMICKMEEIDIEETLSIQSMKIDLSSNLEGSEKSTIEEPFPLIKPLISSSSDTLLASISKISYKDKLMEGLSDTAATKLASKTKQITQTFFAKDSMLLNGKGIRDENHNLTTNDSIKPSECSSMPNLTKSNDSAWNEWKSKKSMPKRSHASGPNSRTDLDNADTSSHSLVNACKNKGKVEKSSKDCLHEIVSKPKNKHIHPKISHSSDTIEAKRGCDVKTPSQLTKRQLRKLKKFCSLDLSELEETSDAKASKINQKWKSHDDLDNLNASPHKADNYLIWPLVGLAVLAGFVAFCFRDKISFMIASRFPFERPPI